MGYNSIRSRIAEKHKVMKHLMEGLVNDSLRCHLSIDRHLPAHRYVLATGSTVFYAMLYSGLADKEAEEIVVPDVDPNAFLAMLKYLYCDDIQLELDTVLATLYSAKKYIGPHLAR